MKGAIFYYSGTGNTALACRRLAAGLRPDETALIDVTMEKSIHLRGLDYAGFAAPTYHMGLPPLLKEALLRLEPQPGLPVFLLNTYGMMQGQALRIMGDLLKGKGLRIVAAHALPMPENYPPFIARGWGNENQPDARRLTAFDAYIHSVRASLNSLTPGHVPAEATISIGFFNRLMRVKGREKIVRELGGFKVDTALCNQCGLCAQVCPHGAMRMENGLPIQDGSRCWGCWRCFNHCPQAALRTDRIASAAQYRRPSEELVKTLQAD